MTSNCLDIACGVCMAQVCTMGLEACTHSPGGRACLVAIAAITLVGSIFLAIGALACNTSFGYNMMMGLGLYPGEALGVSLVGIVFASLLFCMATSRLRA